MWGGGADLHLGGGQEDGIALKGAQSKVKWGNQWGTHDVNGGHVPPAPPPPIPLVTPLPTNILANNLTLCPLSDNVFRLN